MPEWLASQIKGAHDKRYAVKEEEGKEDYIEVDEEIMAKLEDSTFFSSTLIFPLIIYRKKW